MYILPYDIDSALCYRQMLVSIKKKKGKTQRDITIVVRCVSITMLTVRPPQMYRGLGKRK